MGGRWAAIGPRSTPSGPMPPPISGPCSGGSGGSGGGPFTACCCAISGSPLSSSAAVAVQCMARVFISCFIVISLELPRTICRPMNPIDGRPSGRMGSQTRYLLDSTTAAALPQALPATHPDRPGRAVHCRAPAPAYPASPAAAVAAGVLSFDGCTMRVPSRQSDAQADPKDEQQSHADRCPDADHAAPVSCRRVLRLLPLHHGGGFCLPPLLRHGGLLLAPLSRRSAEPTQRVLKRLRLGLAFLAHAQRAPGLLHSHRPSATAAVLLGSNVRSSSSFLPHLLLHDVQCAVQV